jgi:hypothetical protein
MNASWRRWLPEGAYFGQSRSSQSAKKREGARVLVGGLGGQEVTSASALVHVSGVPTRDTTGKSGLRVAKAPAGTALGVHVALPLHQQEVARVLFAGKDWRG